MYTVLFERYRTITHVDTHYSLENTAKTGQFTGEAPPPIQLPSIHVDQLFLI